MTNVIDLEHNCGFITFADIGVPDFGCSNRDPNVRLGRVHRSSTSNPGNAQESYIKHPITFPKQR